MQYCLLQCLSFNCGTNLSMNFVVFTLPYRKTKIQSHITYGIVELLLFSFYITDVPELPPNFGQPEAQNVHSNFSTLTLILVHDPSPRAKHSFSFLEIRVQALIVQNLLTGKKRV